MPVVKARSAFVVAVLAFVPVVEARSAFVVAGRVFVPVVEARSAFVVAERYGSFVARMTKSSISRRRCRFWRGSLTPCRERGYSIISNGLPARCSS